MVREFPFLKQKLAELLALPQRPLSRQDLIDLVCRDCPFWKEDEKDDYECGGFRLLKLLLEQKALTLEAMRHAIGE